MSKKKMNICRVFFLATVVILSVLLAACSSAAPTPATLAGFWQDNDTNVTT